jgi:hypothetical protein
VRITRYGGKQVTHIRYGGTPVTVDNVKNLPEEIKNELGID